MPSLKQPLSARLSKNDAQAQHNSTGTQDSPLTINQRTSSAAKPPNPTNTRPRRDSGCAPDSASRVIKQYRNTPITVPPLKPAAVLPPSASTATTSHHILLSPADFDDFTLDIARSHAIQRLLHATPTSRTTSSTTSTPSLSHLKNTSPLFRSLCICDLNIPGFPIQHRSRHFSLSPRGLRVGDCEFLNLQDMDGGAKEGINLTVRTGVDGRPAFVMECVRRLYAVDGDVAELGQDRVRGLGPPAYVFASQIDVTMRLRGLAATMLRARQDAVERRIAAEEEKEEKERRKKKEEEKTRRLKMQQEQKKQQQQKQQQEQNKEKQNHHVSWVKESLLVHPRHQFHAVPAVADDDSRYFSYSDGSDEDEDESSDDSEETSRSASGTSPSSIATSNSGTNRTSLTSLPNTTFLHYGPDSGAARASASASKQAQQPRTIATTCAATHANTDIDIWLAESLASSRLSDPGYPILPDVDVNVKPHSKLGISSDTLAAHYLAPLLSTLRLLHRSCFALKRQFDRTRTTRSRKYSQWQLGYMSLGLLTRPKSTELVKRAVQMLGGALDDGRDVRVFVPWDEEGAEMGAETQRQVRGEKGRKGKEMRGVSERKEREKDGRWVYAVPMVRGRGGEDVEMEKSWMCFVVWGEVGDLWNMTTTVRVG